jgi:hypothetical protein
MSRAYGRIRRRPRPCASSSCEPLFGRSWSPTIGTTSGSNSPSTGKATCALASRSRSARLRLGSKAATSLVETVKELSQTLDDAQIARILNMKKIPTPRELRWTQDRVQQFRHHHGIRQRGQPPDDRFFTCQQAREYLGVGYNGLMGLIRRGVIHKNQVTDFAPWRIPREELDSEDVQSLVRTLKAKGRLPAGGCPQAQTRLFRGKSTE